MGSRGEDGGESTDAFEAQDTARLDGGLVDGGDLVSRVLGGAGICEEPLGWREAGGECHGDEAYKGTAEVHFRYLSVGIGGRAVPSYLGSVRLVVKWCSRDGSQRITRSAGSRPCLDYHVKKRIRTSGCKSR